MIFGTLFFYDFFVRTPGKGVWAELLGRREYAGGKAKK